MAEQALQLGPQSDLGPLAAAYSADGRVQVRGLLQEDDARRLHAALLAQSAWNLVYRQQGRHVDADSVAVAAWSAEHRARLQQVVDEGAAAGFQYFYENIPLYDLHHRGAVPSAWLAQVFALVNSAPFLAMARQLTGAADITFADAQVTRYRAGHFLTTHDDNVAGKARRAAYVLNLTPQWSSDWGGALQFPDTSGSALEAWLPGWNTLNLFRVPVPHAVGQVAGFATGARLAVTGWLRAGEDPGP